MQFVESVKLAITDVAGEISQVLFNKPEVINNKNNETEQLHTVAELKKEDIIATQEALDHLKNYFEDLYKNKDKFFGNARTVRQTVSEAIKNQNLRMSGISAEQRNTQDIHTLLLEDVIEFKYNGNNLRKTVGFRLGGK